jgi:uncharacterized protein (TIGR03083 family)
MPALFDEPGPILVAPLLSKVEAALLELLDTVFLDEWDRPTIVTGWRVRHVAAHLLDTALRKLAVVRDGFVAEGPRSGAPADVRAFVDRANAAGVAAFGRLSPAVLRTLMSDASAEFCAFHQRLDPFAPAAFAVSWAGETQSANWFDTARELTERWHHQQQIRLALDRPGIMTPELYHPVLDCFIRVLPQAYRDVVAPPGTRLVVRVDGACGGRWDLVRGESRWRLTIDRSTPPDAVVSVPEALAWRLFTKGLTRTEADTAIHAEGDRRLGLAVLDAVAIVG